MASEGEGGDSSSCYSGGSGSHNQMIEPEENTSKLELVSMESSGSDN